MEAILETLAERDYQVVRREGDNATITDADGLPFVLVALGNWVMVYQHLVPREAFKIPALAALVTETAARVNAYPLNGCRLALDPAGLLVLHEIEPESAAVSIERGVYMLGCFGAQLARFFEALLASGETPDDDEIEEALSLDELPLIH